MIDHDRALELAAAFDFGLSDADRVGLQAHLDACPDCRDFAAGLLADARRIADLPTFAAPAELRARIIASAASQPAAEPSADPARADRPLAPRPLPLIPARYRPALAVVGTAAVIIAIVGGTMFSRQPVGGGSDAAASQAKASQATAGQGAASGSASASGDPAASGATPSADPGPLAGNGAWTPVAELTADDIKAGVVALGSGFTLASLDGTPATDLASRVTAEPPIAFAVAANAGGKSARLTPSEPLTPGTVYQFRLTATDGRTLDSWAFQAHQPLHVAGTLPRDEATDVPTDTGIEVTFDQDGVVDAESHISITPKVAGRFERHGRTVAFVPAKRLARSTIYTVTVKRGIVVDGTDEALASDLRFRFETAGPRKATARYRFTDDIVDSATSDRPTLALWTSTDDDDEGRLKPPTTVGIVIHRLPSLDAALAAYRQVRSFPEWARGSFPPVVTTTDLPTVASFDATLRVSRDTGFSWFQLPKRLPTGWYVVSVPSPTRTVQTILQVTDISGYLVVSDTKTLVWVNDLASGEPVPGAVVASDAEKLGRTANDGTLIADTPPNLLPQPSASCTAGCYPVVTVQSGGSALVMPANAREKDLGYGSDIGADIYGSSSAAAAYWSTFDTDRATYRRTDTVNAWGVARERKTGAVPSSVTVRLFSGSEGGAARAPLSTTNVHPDRIGAFSTSIRLDDLPEGPYVLEATVADKVVRSTSFEIGRILKPAYQLDVVTGHRVYVRGDVIKVTATATFFEGSPVPGVPLQLDGDIERAFTTDATGTGIVRWTVGFNSAYTSSDADVRSINVSPARAEEGEISGWSDEIAVFPSSWMVRGNAVIDAGRVQVTGGLHAVDREGLEHAMVAGKSISDLDGTGGPVADRAVKATFTEVTPHRIKTGTRYDFIEKKVVPVYEDSFTERFAGTVRVTTAADGTFSASIAASAGKSYRVALSATDPDGHDARWTGAASAAFEQADVSPGEGDLAPTSGPADDRLFGIGEAIDLTMHDPGIPAGSSGRYVFYTAHQGLRDFVVQRSSRFQTTFEESAAPALSITGVRFTGSGYFESSRYLAYFRESDRELTVGLTADARRYAPGAEARVTVTTHDKSGKTVPATVVLRAVDEKLYAIGAAESAEPLAELYGDVGSGIVMTYGSHAEPSQLGEGGDTTGGGGDQRIRDDFRDAVLFRQITTGQDGTARVSFHVPDDLTSWRVSASAFGADLTAGEASIEIPVGLPFFADATIASEYLASDHPVIGLRAFGTALQADERVTFTVDSDSLGIHLKGIEARAFETATVPIRKLTVGKHAITIKATTDSGANARQDVTTRTFTVVASRLTQTRTAYVAASGGLPKGGEGRVDVIVSDAGAARYIPLLLDLTGADSARLERTLAASLAVSLLSERFHVGDGVAPGSFDSQTYQTEEGVAILPYSSSSLAASAMVALVAPDRFDRERLVEYLWTAADGPKTTREARNIALAGLAGLHEPVLTSLRRSAADPDLTVRERLMLGLGAAALGDAATARQIGTKLLAQHGEVTGETARLRVGKSAADITDATALMAMLAAAVGDPLAGRLWSYVEANPGSESTYSLQAVGFVSRLLERAAPRPATFAYTVDGKRHVVELTAGEAFQISLNHQQFQSLKLEPVAGDVGVATSWREVVTPAAIPKDPDIAISRRISPSGDISSRALVTVDLTVHLGPKAPKGCHVVTDLVPSGLVAVGNLEGWFRANDDELASKDAVYPFAQVGQRVQFCAEKGPKSGDVHLRYFARVVTGGTYTWEPAIVESRTKTGRAAITKATVVTIR
jgi:hypothetical protein